MASAPPPSSSAEGRLAGKTCLVTGASSGFGAAIARRFAEEGAKVLVCDINEEGGQKVASEMAERMVFRKLNVTSAEDWKSVIKEAIGEYGRVDCLVNNAGTSYKNKPTLQVTEDEFDKVFSVNFKSIFHSVPAFVPHLIEQGKGGVMINISSIGSERPRPGLVWYNASKGAVSNATKGLAAEYGPHQIRVNAICPLLSGTGLFEQFAGEKDTPEARQKFLFNVPMGRLTEVDDVANAALYLASDEARFVTGLNLRVDGGKCI